LVKIGVVVSEKADLTNPDERKKKRERGQKLNSSPTLVSVGTSNNIIIIIIIIIISKTIFILLSCTSDVLREFSRFTQRHVTRRRAAARTAEQSQLNTRTPPEMAAMGHKPPSPFDIIPSPRAGSQFAVPRKVAG
jgi:hypothetical protein